jgi:hypothetical protein
MTTRLNRIIRSIELSPHLTLLAKKALLKGLHTQKAALETAEYILRKNSLAPHEILTKTIEQVQEQLKSSTVEIKGLLGKYRNELGHEAENLEAYLKEGEVLGRTIESILTQRGTTEELRSLSPQDQAAYETTLREVILPDRVLKEPAALPTLPTERIGSKSLSPAERTRYILERLVSFFIRGTREKVRGETSLVDRQTIRETVAREPRETIAREVVRVINALLSPLPVREKTEFHVESVPEGTRSNGRAAREATEGSVNKASEFVVRMKVGGQPVKMTSVEEALVEAAIAFVERNPESLPAIAALVSEALQVSEPPVSRTRPAGRHGQTELQTVKTLPEVRGIPQTLVWSPRDSEGLPEIHSQFAKEVFQKVPQAALPLLSEVHAEASEEVKNLIEPIIFEFAQTREGQQFVMEAFAKGKEKVFAVSSFGEKIVMLTAQNLLAQAAQTRLQTTDGKFVSKTLMGQAPAERLLTISRLVAAENTLTLAPENLTPASAASFLTVVARIQAYFNLAVTLRKNIEPSLRRAVPAANTLGQFMPGQRKIPPGHGAQTPLPARQLAEMVANLRQLSKAEKINNLVIPDTVTKNMATAFLVPRAISLAPFFSPFSLPSSSPSATSMQRIVRALEAQITRGLTLRDATVWNKVFALSAQVMLYGIIMRLVGGRISEIDAIVTKLKRERKLGGIVKVIKKGDLDSATAEIYPFVPVVSDSLAVAA